MTIFPTAAEMGRAAALELAEILQRAVAEKCEAGVILATGNSQLSLYAALRTDRDIPWGKVSVFHMDEYIGMSDGHPASFRRYMHEKLVDSVHPRAFCGIEADANDIEAEIARYTRLLVEKKPVASVMGIGENGHLAFNDPPADFSTSASIHLVKLAESAPQCVLQPSPKPRSHVAVSTRGNSQRHRGATIGRGTSGSSGHLLHQHGSWYPGRQYQGHVWCGPRPSGGQESALALSGSPSC